MLHRFLLGLVLMIISGASVFAHHGWGSYDASKPITVTGPIETSRYENPHATITVKAADKVWTVQVKAALIVLGLSNAFFTGRAVRPLLDSVPAFVPLPRRVRLSAYFSLGIWVCVAARGRLIAYF
jgi:hypothetical protein